MRVSNMLIGHSSEEPIELPIENQVRHLCIVGGGHKAQSEKVVSNILDHQILKGYGVLVIQHKESNIKKEFIKNLRENGRGDDFVEIYGRRHTDLSEELLDGMGKGKLMYFDASSNSKESTIDFFNSLSDAIEQLRQFESKGKRFFSKPFVILGCDIEKFKNPVWEKMLVFARQLNIVFVSYFYNYSHFEEMTNDREQINTFESIFEITGTKLLFNQENSDQNTKLSKIFGVPKIERELGLSSFFKLQKTDKYLLEVLDRNEFLMMDWERFMVLSIP